MTCPVVFPTLAFLNRRTKDRRMLLLPTNTVWRLPLPIIAGPDLERELGTSLLGAINHVSLEGDVVAGSGILYDRPDQRLFPAVDLNGADVRIRYGWWRRLLHRRPDMVFVDWSLAGVTVFTEPPKAWRGILPAEFPEVDHG